MMLVPSGSVIVVNQDVQMHIVLQCTDTKITGNPGYIMEKN